MRGTKKVNISGVDAATAVDVASDEFGASDIQVADDRGAAIDAHGQPMVSASNAGAIDINLIDTTELRARQYARVLENARELGTSTTIHGGKFLVNGEWVNAYGDLIDPNTGDVLQRRYKPIDGIGGIYDRGLPQ